MQFGVVGLGRIGGGLALQALGKNVRVAGFDPFYEPGKDERNLVELGLVHSKSLEDLASALSPANSSAAINEPRVIFLYVHAGKLVDESISALSPHLSPGDIIVDGGNSYWGDSIRRAKALLDKGIHLVDVGTSGGVTGVEKGACFMAGGDLEAIKHVGPILELLSTADGYVHCGPSGTGHFVKLVHNGVEFGMLQAIGEGVDLLEKYDEKLPVESILKTWRHGSVVRSWLIDLMHQEYQHHGEIEKVPAYIEDTGEVNWLVADAMRLEVPIPIISQSVMQLFASRDQSKHWARAVAMMRHGFGGHPYGPDANIAHDRQTSRVGDIFNPAKD